MALRDGEAPVFFYELHESDTDLYADVLLAHETEYDEAEFLELVLESRARVIDDFRQDSLIEAVAADLAERAGFLVVDDSQLRVAVNVSAEDDGTFVADVARPVGAAAAWRTSAPCSSTWSPTTPSGVTTGSTDGRGP